MIAWATAAVCLPAIVNVFWPLVPVHPTEDWKVARRFAELYRATALHVRFPHVIASHMGIYYYLDIDPRSHNRSDGFARSAIQNPPEGAILVWDPIFSASNANTDNTASLEMIRDAGWGEHPELSDRIGAGWHIFERGK
jgi:hypothetical protein